MAERSVVNMIRYMLNQAEKNCRKEEKGWLPISEAKSVVDESAQDQFSAAEAKADLMDLLPHINPRKRRVLELRYWNDLTQEQIAHQLNVSHVRVQQIEADALKNLRELANRRGLESKVRLLMQQTTNPSKPS